jgi:3-hydroxyacyl-[acyl-carrier-protein] dehydratase
MRWIWIDRFERFESGKTARAVKNLSRAEDYFADHFPGWPVMPAALMIEGVAQTGGILVGEANQFREKVILAKVQRATFRREVTAGERLVYDAEIVNLRPEGASVLGKISVNEEPVGEVEIFFAHLDQSRAGAIFGEHNFVFGGEMKYLLGRLAGLAATTGAREGTG